MAPAEPTTLVVLGSSLTALAVVRVARRAGYRCLMLDDRPGPASTTRCARYRRLPDARLETVDAAIRASGGAAIAVIADSDRWLRFVREHRERLRAAGWLVLHPTGEAITTCLDKSAFLDWCAARALPAPRRYAPEALRAQPATAAFPLMLRPEWTQHSADTGLPKAIEVREPQALAGCLARYAAADIAANVCDSLLRPGIRQFSVGAARSASGHVRTFLAEKLRPAAEQCAGGTYVRPATCAGVEALAARALEALDYLGVAEVEILHDPRTAESFLIEVNARPWLQFGLPHASGCDLLGHALGRGASSGEFDPHHGWLYFSSDLYACFSRTTGLVRTGRLSLGAYLASIARADVFATWDLADPLPLLSACWRAALARIRPAARRP